MRAHAAIFAGLLLLAGGEAVAKEEPPPIAVLSFADTSCGTWDTSKSDIARRQLYVYWFRGFVSGFNFANTKEQVTLDAMPDNETLVLYVDKFCRENPLRPFTFAAFDLVKELQRKSK
jgi:hypothetical protein